MEAFYETLNVSPSADEREIRSAYRRLAKVFHPDAGPGSDPHRFQEIHAAYRALLGRLTQEASGGGRPDFRAEAEETAQTPWRFEGVLDRGADQVYQVVVSRRSAEAGLHLNLPWRAEDACPRCMGAGHTLFPVFGGPHLRKTVCLKCQGSGVIRHESSVHLDLIPDMIRQGRVRLKDMGHYRPTAGVRGDLVVELRVGDTDRQG